MLRQNLPVTHILVAMAVRRQATTEVMSDHVRHRLELLLAQAQPRRGDTEPGPLRMSAEPAELPTREVIRDRPLPVTRIEAKGWNGQPESPPRGSLDSPGQDQTVVRRGASSRPADRSPTFDGEDDLSPHPAAAAEPARAARGVAVIAPGSHGEDSASAPEPPRSSTVWGFGRRHLQVIGLLLAAGVLLGGYALTRARSHPVVPPAIAAAPLAPTPGTSNDPGGSSAPGPNTASESVSAEPDVLVHVVGAVNRPGVYRLPSGSRVVDAVDSAGGLAPRARPGELNFAQPLDDGQQVVVGTSEQPGGEVRGAGQDGTSGGSAPSSDGTSTTTDGGGSSGSAGDKINLNKATAAQLDTLPGVGPVTAGKIITWRDQNKKFSRIEELQEVPGIGPKTYAELSPLVTV